MRKCNIIYEAKYIQILSADIQFITCLTSSGVNFLVKKKQT